MNNMNTTQISKIKLFVFWALGCGDEAFKINAYKEELDLRTKEIATAKNDNNILRQRVQQAENENFNLRQTANKLSQKLKYQTQAELVLVSQKILNRKSNGEFLPQIDPDIVLQNDLINQYERLANHSSANTYFQQNAANFPPFGGGLAATLGRGLL